MLDALGKLNARGFEQIRRSGDPDPHRPVRDGLPHADERAGADRPQPRNRRRRWNSTARTSTSPGSFAGSALLARRLVERGVRVVQILHRGWDPHGNLPDELGNQCMDTDQASAALVTDLKQRGLLDDTLVVWGGEFGRTVYSQGTLTRENYGRDHHPRNFCMWMAGGGIKGGVELGETDDFPTTPWPIRSTSTTSTPPSSTASASTTRRFTFHFQGLDQRLTGVEPMKVIKQILA